MKKLLFIAIVCQPILLSAQNIGIGTPNPYNKLHIVSTDTNGIKLENTNVLNTGVSNGIYFKSGSWITGAIKQTGTGVGYSRTGIWGYASLSEDALKEYMSITDDGNVGIGNIAPTQKLVVAGNTTVTGHTLSNTLQSATSLQVGTTIQASGNISTTASISAGGNITATGAIYPGTTTATTNGAIRFALPDNKMEYREDNTWKRISKPFYQSNTVSITSAVRNTLLVHPSFEWTVPETGYYQVNLITDVYPVFKTNGCTLQYLDNAAAVWVYSKTRAIQFFSGGDFKWYIVNGQTGCQGAQSIPLKPSNNRIIYLQKDEVMTLAYQMDMYTVPGGTLDNWTAQGNVNFVKVD